MPDGRMCSDVAISTVDTTRNEEDEDEYTEMKLVENYEGDS